MGRTLYDQVIKKLKENKNREYLIVERSIDQVCKDDPIEPKQLYVEALDCKDSMHRIPLTIGVGSFAMSVLSLMKSMGCIGKMFDILLVIFIGFCAVMVFCVCKRNNHDKYNNYILQIVEDKCNFIKNNRK